MSELEVVVEIKRPPHEVRAWWLDLPDDYRATDPREQPHRIVTVRKDESTREMRTYWRGPLGREVVVPETFHVKVDGDWDVEVHLPFGLRQRDEFRLEPTSDGTRVRIRVVMTAPSVRAKLAKPLYWRFYASRNYPRTWRAAARICERDAPVIPVGAG